MKIIKLGGTFILYLFLYSVIGLLIDFAFQNNYNDVTYAIRRLIQLALHIMYIVFITRSNQIVLRYKIEPKRLIGYGVVLFACIFLYESTVDVFINHFLTPDQASQAREAGIAMTLDYPVAFFIEACISAPLLEEVLVRGVLYEMLRERLAVVWSVLITSAFFAFMHFDGFNSLFYMMVGAMFSYTYVKTRSIGYCIILHVCVNAVSLIGYYV